MSTKKKVVALASSAKGRGRCVAGKEIHADGSIGRWIRPVTSIDEGALGSEHYVTSKGGAVAPLDIVQISLVKNVSARGQPENWTFEEDVWEHCGQYSGSMAAMTDDVDSLWQDKGPTDKIAENASILERMPQSLALISVPSVSLSLSRDYNQWKGYHQKSVRAIFSFKGVDYSLKVTEMNAPYILDSDYPEKGGGPRTKLLKGNCFMCVSLTGPFNGSRYKVIASIIVEENDA